MGLGTSGNTICLGLGPAYGSFGGGNCFMMSNHAGLAMAPPLTRFSTRASCRPRAWT